MILIFVLMLELRMTSATMCKRSEQGSWWWRQSCVKIVNIGRKDRHTITSLSPSHQDLDGDCDVEGDICTDAWVENELSHKLRQCVKDPPRSPRQRACRRPGIRACRRRWRRGCRRPRGRTWLGGRSRSSRGSPRSSLSPQTQTWDLNLISMSRIFRFKFRAMMTLYRQCLRWRQF